MSLLKGFVGEVAEALDTASKAGINLCLSEQLDTEKIASQSRELLDRLLTAGFLQSIPETSLPAADKLKTVLQHVAIVAGMIERGEAADY